MNEEDGKKDLKVEKIQYGVVIDGLLVRSSIRALKLLGISFDMSGEPDKYIIIPLSNVKSNRLNRRKDILKIEVERPEELPELLKLVEANSGNLALISQQITIHHIDDWKVVHDYKPTVPDTLVDIVNCPRYNCVTHEPKKEGSNDHYQSRFDVVKRDPHVVIKCYYCSMELSNAKIIENLILK